MDKCQQVVSGDDYITIAYDFLMSTVGIVFTIHTVRCVANARIYRRINVSV